MALVYLSAAWLAGVYLGLEAGAPVAVAPLWASACAGLALLWWAKPRVRWPLLVGAVLALGTWRGGAALSPPGAGHVAGLNGQEVVLRGSVDSEPQYEHGGQRFVFAAGHLLVGESPEPLHGRVWVATYRFPQVRLGEVVQLSGRLEAPPEFDTFSYSDYLARQDIYSLIRYPRLSIQTEGGPPSPLTALREALSISLARALPEPQSALAASLLVGDTSRLPDDLVEAFRITGTGHILAVSGWQVSIVVGLLSGIALPIVRVRALRFVLVALATVGYALLAGGAPAVVRAALMAVVVLLALQLGRPRDGLVGLALACLAMTAYRPQMLFDVGFQLSALATLGLIALGPRFQTWFRWAPLWLGAVLATTLAAQIAVLPLTAVTFRQLSPVSLLVNLAAVPTVPGAMEWSAAAAALGLLWPPLGAVAGWVAWLHLAALTWVVETGSRFAYVSVNTEAPHAALVLAYYGALLLWLDGGRRMAPVWTWLRARATFVPRRFGLAALAGVAVLALSVFCLRPGEELRVSVLDVGQGDAILIQSPAGYKTLVDGGPDGVAIANALGRRLPYWDKSLDLVVLTHQHDDHLVGLIDILQGYEVRQVLQGRPPERPTPAYKRWAELLQAKGLIVHDAQVGQQVGLGGGARLRVLYAGEAWDGSDLSLNDNSLVLQLERGPTSFYLMGDAGPTVQRVLLANGLVPGPNLLKVPHHGAEGSLDVGFLRALAPTAAFISVGQSNRFGHPSANTIAQLAPAAVYRTDLYGSLEVTMWMDGYSAQRSR